MTKKLTIELPDGVRWQNGIKGQDIKFTSIVTIDTPEAAQELKKRIDAELDKAKRPAGMPEDGQEVFLLTEDGEIVPCTWNDANLYHFGCFWQGNIFFTRALAEKDRDRRKALQRVKAWKQENISDDDLIEVAPLSLRDLPIMRGLNILDAGRFIESCESDLRTLAGVE